MQMRPEKGARGWPWFAFERPGEPRPCRRAARRRHADPVPQRPLRARSVAGAARAAQPDGLVQDALIRTTTTASWLPERTGSLRRFSLFAALALRARPVL